MRMSNWYVAETRTGNVLAGRPLGKRVRSVAHEAIKGYGTMDWIVALLMGTINQAKVGMLVVATTWEARSVTYSHWWKTFAG